jgi:hypothetical protein
MKNQVLEYRAVAVLAEAHLIILFSHSPGSAQPKSRSLIVPPLRRPR